MSCMTGAKLPIFWSLPGCRFKSENYSLQTLLERPEHILMSSLRMRSDLNKQDHPGSFCLRVWSGLCLRPSGRCMGGVVRWAEGNDDADWHHANITSVAAWCETFPTIKEIRILRLPLRCYSRQIVSFARVLCTVRLQRVCWLEQLGSSIPASRLPDAHASTAQPLSLRLALRRTVRIVLLIMDGDASVKDDLTEPWRETGHSRFCLVGTFLSMVTMETPHLLVEGACSRSWYHECANRTVPVYREQTFHNVSCSAFYLNGISCFIFF